MQKTETYKHFYMGVDIEKVKNWGKKAEY